MVRVSFPKITKKNQFIFTEKAVTNRALYIARGHGKQTKATSQLPNKGTFLASSFTVLGGGRGREGSRAKSIWFDQ
jgi:hypothetical protein